MKLLVALVGLILVLEGLPYAVAPEKMQKWLKQVLKAEPAVLRILGSVAILIGLLLCYLAQRTSIFG